MLQIPAGAIVCWILNPEREVCWLTESDIRPHEAEVQGNVCHQGLELVRCVESRFPLS